MRQSDGKTTEKMLEAANLKNDRGAEWPVGAWLRIGSTLLLKTRLRADEGKLAIQYSIR
jgi:hypothetical protein